MPNARVREVWVDDAKLVACVLVVLGHLFQGLVKAHILVGGPLYGWFEMTIYTFHVPLFFVCSGYLYQRYSKVEAIGDWWRSVLKKALTLGVPYIAFTCVTLAMKTLARDAINTQETSLLRTLRLQPTAPYWYLYTLFFIFVVTPTASSLSQMLILLAISMSAKVANLSADGLQSMPYAIVSVTRYWCWFVSGMCLSALSWKDGLTRSMGLACLCFLPLSIVAFAQGASDAVHLLVGVFACVCILSLCCSTDPSRRAPMLDACEEYTMPIYLLHTIFSAGIRVVLLRFGIASAFTHMSVGIVAGLIGPVVAMLVMERLAPLDFFVYPTRYVRIGAQR